MTVPEIGISRGATGMVGEILDQDGNIMDPCDGGADFPLPPCRV